MTKLQEMFHTPKNAKTLTNRFNDLPNAKRKRIVVLTKPRKGKSVAVDFFFHRAWDSGTTPFLFLKMNGNPKLAMTEMGCNQWAQR